MAPLAVLRKAARTVSLAMLAALILTPLLQILMRGVFSLPLAGAEELAKYFLICLVLIGACCVSAEGGQIRMEEFQAVLPLCVKRPLRLLIALSAAGFFSLLLLASVVTVIRNFNSVTPVLEMPFPVFFAPLVFGSALLLVESIVALFRTWSGRFNSGKQTVLS